MPRINEVAIGFTPAFTPHPLDALTNCCQKVVIGAVPGQISAGNYINQGLQHNGKDYYIREDGAFILSFEPGHQSWQVTSVDQGFASPGTPTGLIAFLQNEHGQVTCIPGEENVANNVYYFHEGGWQTTSTNKFYCDDAGPPESDCPECLIPKGTKCFGNQFSVNEESKIVGGTEAVAHSWPWIVSMVFFEQVRCGGSILNSEWILTAAHCCEPALSLGFDI